MWRARLVRVEAPLGAIAQLPDVRSRKRCGQRAAQQQGQCQRAKENEGKSLGIVLPQIEQMQRHDTGAILPSPILPGALGTTVASRTMVRMPAATQKE